MKMVLDTHVHTLASGHAYSTLMEYVEEARKKGLELFAQTDHGPAMPGGPHAYHIGNQIVIPRVIHGIQVLRGVEANILDREGTLDVPLNYLKRLDIIIASLHEPTIASGTSEENTQAIIAAMQTGMVDVIAHAGNPRFPIDIESFIRAAGEYRVLVEINNSSISHHSSRKGSDRICLDIARCAKEHNVPVIAGSDAHISFQLGVFDGVQATFDAVGMPEHLVMNTSVQKLKDFLKSKGRNLNA